jgi:hypothetical protein
VNSQTESPFDRPRDDNPFASPLVTTPVSYGARHRAGREAPTFPKAMAILDLLFYAIRVGAILFVLSTARATLAWALEYADALAWIEIVAGVAMTMCGAVAAVGILMKAAWAAPVGWITAACTLVSIGAGVSQLLLVVVEVGGNAVDGAPFLVGALGAFFIRLCLLIAYASALVKYAAWVRQREEAAIEW